jgi:hypothetical protein
VFCDAGSSSAMPQIAFCDAGTRSAAPQSAS